MTFEAFQKNCSSLYYWPFKCCEKSGTLSHQVSSSANGNQTNSQDYEAQKRWVICLIYKQWGIIQMVAAITFLSMVLLKTKNWESIFTASLSKFLWDILILYELRSTNAYLN